MELILQGRSGGLPPSLAVAHILLSVLVFICFLSCIMWALIISHFLASIPVWCVFVLYSQQECEPCKQELCYLCVLLSLVHSWKVTSHDWRGHGLWSCHTWAQGLTLPLTKCVTNESSFYLSELPFPHL